MPAGHHRKTTPWTLRLRRLRKPAGFALTLALATPIAASTQISTADKPATTTAASSAAGIVRTDMRAASRSSHRLSAPVPRPVKATEPAVRVRPRWTTTRLKVRANPGEGSRLLAVLGAGAQVRVTGTVRGQWAEAAWKDRKAWVRTAYLTPTKPSATAFKKPAGVSGAACPDGSAVETGLQANTVKLYRAVCAAFPAVNAWGGRSGSGGNHGTGRALDIMCTSSLGGAIANYVRSHASELGVSEVIWAQRIWTVQRSSEGWRPMADRGSATANHYDHVHVSLY
ncbi:MAG: SH3 domain-containing protein [Frankiaceae bacterium]